MFDAMHDGKSRSKRMLERALRFMARAMLRKYRPIVVGVTGSIGKTSAKEAIALVLGAKYAVRKSEENYNNEIGTALTIIGARSGKRSIIRWLIIAFRWGGSLLFRRRYPEVLVLEMGVDRPGDMEYLLDFVPADIGVLTHISGSHMEFFGSLENIAKEKGLLLRRLPRDGTAIVNADNEYALRAAKKLKAKILTYGFSARADIRAEQVGFAEGGHGGIYFRLNYSGTMLPIRLPRVVARHHIPAVLAATGVGLAFKLNLIDIAVALERFESLPGRARPLAGIRGSLVIDDTYNASPASLQAAIETVRDMPAVRRVAILGDMLELGNESEAAHSEAGRLIHEAGFRQVILVGSRMIGAYEKLQDLGWSTDRLAWVESPLLAADTARAMIRKGDLILIKGSQGMRMEIVVEALIVDSARAPELLCRQSPEWRKKPFVKPY